MSPVEVVSEFNPFGRGRKVVVMALFFGASILFALLMAFAYARWEHWKQDEINHHAMIELLNYNLQKGHLELPPTMQAPPPVPTPVPVPSVPTPTPPKVEEKKK